MNESLEKLFQVNPNAFQYSIKLNKRIGKSVHFDDKERFDIAKKQRDKSPVSISCIVELVNELFDLIGIETVDEKSAIMDPNNVNYEEIKKKHHLNDIGDIVWIKFTQSGHVGVVAVSNDIGFDIPRSAREYNDKIIEYNRYSKCYEKKWKYTTSGILVHSVYEKWDESFVLVFPLEWKEENCKYDRHMVEIAVGNYLEQKGVPIIDYYSHNY